MSEISGAVPESVSSFAHKRESAGGRNLLQLPSANRVGENGRIRSLPAAGSVGRWVFAGSSRLGMGTFVPSTID